MTSTAVTAITAARAARGTKRHCQNGQCGEPFYDLNRSDIACPHCGSGYTIVAVAPAEIRRPYGRSAFRSAPVAAPVVVRDEEATEAAEVDIEVEADGDDIADASEAILDEDEAEEPGALDVIPPAGGDEE